MMTKMQISFERETLRKARVRAAELGVSLAEYVRRLVAADLMGPSRETDPSNVFNLGSSLGSDVVREKDSMLSKGFGEGLR